VIVTRAVATSSLPDELERGASHRRCDIRFDAVDGNVDGGVHV
jgi:hypothetical protein